MIRSTFARLDKTLIRQLLQRRRRRSGRPERPATALRGLRMEQLEARIALAYTAALVGDAATFTGDNSGDVLTFDVAGGFLRHNRFTAGDAGFESDQDFSSTDAGVQTLAASAVSTVSINTGDGDDTINLGTALVSADSLLAGFTINPNGGTTNTLNVDLSASGAANTLTFDGASAFNTLTDTNLSVGRMNPFSGGVHLKTGTAANTVNVLSTLAGEPLSVDGTAGTLQVNVGQVGSLAALQAQVNVRANGLSIDGSASANNHDVTVTAVGGGQVDVAGLAPVTIRFESPLITTGVALSTGTGNDTFSVDFGSGAEVLPAGNLHVDGGAGNDSAALNGGVVSAAVYNASGAGSGNVSFDGRTLTFANLTPLSILPASLTTLDVNITDGLAHSATIRDDGAAVAGVSFIDLDGGLEDATFTNPSSQLNVSMGGLNDTVTLAALEAGFGANIRIGGGGGDDTVNILATPAGTQTTVDSGPGNGNNVYVGRTSLAAVGTGTLAGLAGGLALNGSGQFHVWIDNGTDVADRDWNFDAPIAGRGRVAVAGVGSTIDYDSSRAQIVKAVGGSGDDRFIIQLSGSDPLPVTRLELDGRGQAAGGDSLELHGGAALNQVTHTFTNASSGMVRLNDFSPGNDLIQYTGLEPILDNLNVAHRVFTFSSAAGDAALTTSPVSGATHTRLDSSVSESVDFTTPTSSLTINLANGTNALSVTSLAGDYNTPTNTIAGGTGADTVNFEVSTSGVNGWTVNAGSGVDRVNLSPVARNLSNLTGPINVSGGANTVDVLWLFDDNNAAASVYSITSSALNRAGFAGVNYDGTVELVVLNAGSDSDTIQVTSTVSTTSIVVNGGNGNDTLNLSPVAQDLNNLAGAVTFNGGGGNDAVNIRDDNRAAGDTYALTSGSLTRSGFGGVNYAADVESVTLNTGAGNDTVNVLSTSGTAATAIDTQGGADSVFVGRTGASAPGTGSLAGLAGPLSLNDSSGGLNVTIDNGTDGTSRNWLVGSLVAGTGRVSLSGISGLVDYPTAGVQNLTINGGGGDDVVTVDFSGGNPSDPLPQSNLLIEGGGQTTGDSIVLNGASMNQVTHTFASENSGSVNFDDFATNNLLTYTGLEPILDNLDVANRVFTFLNPAPDISLTASPLLPATHTRLDSSVSELVDFTTATSSLTIHLANGGNTLTVTSLAGNYNTPNNLIHGGTGADTVNMEVSTSGAGGWTINAGDGNDTLNLSPVAQDLDNLTGRVFFLGGPNGLDQLVIFDNNDTGGNNYIVTSSTVDRPSWGGVSYDGDVEHVTLNAGADGDVIDVLSTSASAPVLINGLGGHDTVNLSPIAQNLDDLASRITFNGGDGNDTLNIRDNNKNSGDIYGVTSSTVDRGGWGGVTYDAAVEQINLVDTGGGDDIIDVVSTSGTATTTIHSGAGDDLFRIAAGGLGGSNLFQGGDNDDTFHVNISGSGGIAAPLTIEGGANDFGGGVGSRDQVLLNDNFGLNIAGTLTYTGGVGGSEAVFNGLTSPLTINTVETLHVNGDAAANDSLTVNGTGGDDRLTVAPVSPTRALIFNGGQPFDGPPQLFGNRFPGVSGSSSAPDLNVNGLATNGLFIDDAGGTGNQLYVYGQTELGLNDGNANDPFGFGAGLLLPAVGSPAAYDVVFVADGLVTIDNLVRVNFNGAAFQQADPNRPALIVNTGDERSPAANGMADDIHAQPSTRLAIRVNGGDPTPESAPRGDRLNVAVPGELNIFSDKSSPPIVSLTTTDPVSGLGTLPLSWTSIENTFLTPGLTSQKVNLIGDNNDPQLDQPDHFVVVGADVDSQGPTLASLAANPYFNPLGLPVHPNFEVDADGDNELVVSINGSAPISIRNVTKLDVLGDDKNLTRSVANDVDTLEISPYADNSPTGWGVGVYFNEGNPAQADGTADLLIYHTSAFGGGVSEQIVIQPSGPENGQIRVTNASFGTPVVNIDFVNNLDIIIIDDDGSASDTDTLTLRGTSPSTPAASGRDAVTANFGAAGTVADPMVTFSDAASAALLYRVRSVTDIRHVRFELLDGFDSISVWAHPQVSVHVDGGGPAGTLQNPGDVLNVISGGGPLSFQAGPQGDQGTLAVSGMTPISFGAVETLRVDGVNYVLPDRFEANATIAAATVLGSNSEIIQRDLTLHGTAGTASGVDGTTTSDVDFYRVTANKTGLLVVNSLFTHANGNLRLDVFDGSGNLIAGVNSTDDNEQLIIPVAAQRNYYVRVSSVDGRPTAYSLEIENLAAVAPTAIDLHSSDDSGRSNQDNVTFVNDSQILISADLSEFAAAGIPILTAAQAAAGNVSGAAVEVLLNGVSAGFADSVSGLSTLFQYVFLPGQLAAGSPVGPGVSPPVANDAFGRLNLVTAAVRVVDGQTPNQSARGPSSAKLALTFDASAPNPGLISLELAPNSDTANPTDNITAINKPAFWGIAEANTLVRIYATPAGGLPILVGQGVTGSDRSDVAVAGRVIGGQAVAGLPNDGLGLYEITTQALADGNYIITVVTEDLAGNTTDRLAGPVLAVTIDATPPQRPTIDLIDASDTGASRLDNVTQGSPTGSGFFRVSAELGTNLLIKDGDVIINSLIFDAALDAADGLLDGHALVLIDFTVNQAVFGIPAEGAHSLSTQAIDTAGNQSAQSTQLLATIDFTAPMPPSMELLSASDSGVIGDGITNINRPAFRGIAEANTRVRIYAQPPGGQVELVGEGLTGSDSSDVSVAGQIIGGQFVAGLPDDGRGLWEVTIEPLVDDNYVITVELEDLAGNISDIRSGPAIPIIIDTLPPQRPTIDLIDADDTGSSSLDNVTIGDPAGAGDFRISADLDTVVIIKDGNTVIDVFVFDAAADLADGVLDGFTIRTIDFLVNEALFGIAGEGPHPLSVETFDIAANRSLPSPQLLVTIDFTAPAPPTMELLSTSDSGVKGDGLTNVSQPAFWGIAEANTHIRIFAQPVGGLPVLIGEGTTGSDTSDVPVAGRTIGGQTVAGLPDDGLGLWEITVEPLVDGDYIFTVLAEDLAGNASVPAAGPTVLLTIDTLPPQRLTIDLIDADDTGRSDVDNITKGDASQGNGIADFRISAELGSTVHIKDGEVVIRSLVFDAALDAADGVLDGFAVITLNFVTNQGLFLIPAQGPHPLSAEAFDDAGNRSAQSEELLVTIDFTSPVAPSTPDLAGDSDSGMSDSDNVTNIREPRFLGTAEANSQIRLYATNVVTGVRQLAGGGTVNSDESDGAPTNGVGTWSVTAGALDDGVYDITVEVEDAAGNISPLSVALRIEIDTAQPNLPYLDLRKQDDTGRSDDDNITRVTNPIFTATSEDPNATLHTFLFPAGHNFKYRIFDRPAGAAETLLYDSFVTLGGFTNLSLVTTPPLTLSEGLHNLKLEVEDRAGNISHDFTLDVVIDTAAPPVSIIGLFGSDTGVAGSAASLADRVTANPSPVFVGRAEANAVVRLYVDGREGVNNSNRVIDNLAQFGLTVAVPLDGDDAFPNGQWQTGFIRSLNDPGLFDFDGVREVLVTAEDVAGNVSSAQFLDIFLDTQGPQVTAVQYTANPGFNVFAPKPSAGPTPLANQLSIRVSDGPARSNQDPNFLYSAVFAQAATNPGNYLLVGDDTGVVAITKAEFFPNPAQDNVVATGEIRLTFAAPLADDRYTLTVSDRITDIAGNGLDGATNTTGPSATPIFPSGDGQGFQSFAARFTVDSRPEIATWAGGTVWADTNGNGRFDPGNPDAVNRDIVYTLGLTTDNIFAGNFSATAGSVADGFDKLAAYGFVGGSFRWLIDVNHDGVPDVIHVDPTGVNGLPVAGEFDGNAANGDEVAIFDGKVWHFDTDHDFEVGDAGGSFKLATSMRGFPVVGDFNNDGLDDLGTWTDDQFQIDLASGPGPRTWDGVADFSFRFGFIGVRERPIVADMDRDGYADLGLWVPDRGGQLPKDKAEWYFLVSGGAAVTDRIRFDNSLGVNVIEFRPQPFGKDLFFSYGDQFALPLVGNFDPPIDRSPQIPGGGHLNFNTRDPFDVNNDGKVDTLDLHSMVLTMFKKGSYAFSESATSAPYLDVFADGIFSPRDIAAELAYFTRRGNAGSQSEGERVLTSDSLADAYFFEIAKKDKKERHVDDVLVDAILRK